MSNMRRNKTRPDKTRYIHHMRRIAHDNTRDKRRDTILLPVPHARCEATHIHARVRRDKHTALYAYAHCMRVIATTVTTFDMNPRRLVCTRQSVHKGDRDRDRERCEHQRMICLHPDRHMLLHPSTHNRNSVKKYAGHHFTEPT